MKFEEIKEIVKIIDSSSIDLFELNNDKFYIKLGRNNNVNYNSIVTQRLEKDQIGQHDDINTPITILPEEKNNVIVGNLIKSPIVGTFYSSREPGQAPFVKVGQKVSKGDVVCIIEAMKVMNEITSCYNGEIAEVLVKDGEMIEFDQIIFKVI